MPDTLPEVDANLRALYLWPAAAADFPELARQLRFFGFDAQLFDAAPAFLAALAARPPQAVLVDAMALQKLPAQMCAAFSENARSCSTIFVADGGSLQDRLAAVRMGCHAYLVRPLSASAVLDVITRLASPQQAEAGKVLIVEDSPATAALYAEILRAAGFVSRSILDPMQVLEALQDSVPELILMDMHMPGASGEELAKVIRQQDAYLSIPIVFLSAETDADRQREAMALGGDEFLQKPIKPEHLVSAVKSRIARYRGLRAIMMRDSLTGLLNHTTFKERLRAEAARAARTGKPLAVAMLDIDRFKRVNDSYGHPAGDRVIKALAILLKRRLRSSDVIGRYGGEEFALALPDTDIAAARELVEQIRGDFAEIGHAAKEGVFRCTLSAGLSNCPPYSDAEALIEAADEALYAAKRGGRNLVMLAD